MEADSAHVDGSGAIAFKDVLSGALAGLAATWAMTRFQTALSSAMETGSSDEDDATDSGDAEEDSNGSAPATVRAADAASRVVRGRPLRDAEKGTAGNLAHYGFGTIAGAAYGVAAAAFPFLASGRGLTYGAVLWLTADEITVPAVGLSPSPTKMPASTHAFALASHLVYGVTADALRRAIRTALD